ncbi:hypothetical protein K0M31_002915 [Melipona bicolor]|uniref:Uncharacterized protein n=1 Tax=Melipona bicolor TaxID=60889 RepID=A0AA40G000_9HYME|nr:hypothetical protein K0M31_002915 [Melipona bicolor]
MRNTHQWKHFTQMSRAARALRSGGSGNASSAWETPTCTHTYAGEPGVTPGP